MQDLISNFFDASFQLDLILKKNDLNNKNVKHYIELLNIILQKSIEKSPLQNHIVFRQKIGFYQKAFEISMFKMII